MSLLDGQPAEGQTTENQDTQTQDTQQTNDTSQTTFNQDATSTIDFSTVFGEYANDPSIQKFKNPQDLAKSYLELQKVIGKKRIPVPEKPEDIPQVLKELGLPDSPDKYPDIEGYDKIFGSQEEYVEFKKIMHEAGILPQQYEKITQAMKQIIEQDEQLTMQQRQQLAQQSLQQLSQEWGDEAQAKLKTAQQLFQTLPPETQQKIVEAGLDVDANFVKFLASVGEYYKEDSFVTANYTPADAKSELNAILTNPKHPYFDKSHPEHEAAVEKVQKLYKIIYG